MICCVYITLLHGQILLKTLLYRGEGLLSPVFCGIESHGPFHQAWTTTSFALLLDLLLHGFVEYFSFWIVRSSEKFSPASIFSHLFCSCPTYVWLNSFLCWEDLGCVFVKCQKSSYTSCCPPRLPGECIWSWWDGLNKELKIKITIPCTLIMWCFLVCPPFWVRTWFLPAAKSWAEAFEQLRAVGSASSSSLKVLNVGQVIPTPTLHCTYRHGKQPVVFMSWSLSTAGTFCRAVQSIANMATWNNFAFDNISPLWQGMWISTDPTEAFPPSEVTFLLFENQIPTCALSLACFHL